MKLRSVRIPGLPIYFKFLFKWFFILASLVIFVLVLVYIIRLDKGEKAKWNPYFFRDRPTRTNTYSNEISKNLSNLKQTGIMDDKKLVILFYGLFYDQPLFPELIEGYCSKSLPYSIIRAHNCSSHDVVILHFDNYNKFMENCAISRSSNKKFMIIYFMEPPFSTKNYFSRPPFSENYHILTNSFHQESMLRSTYFQFTKNERFADFDILKKEFATRRRSAFVAISACQTSNTIRIEYVNILGNHFKIDKYGDCFGHRISNDQNANDMTETMFVLAFENCVCKDYITEKYCRSLIYGAIPIVMTSPTNTNQLIPGSFINAFDFESPQDLALHLIEISHNFTMYKSYFEWKHHYRLDTCKVGGDACEIINKIYHLKNSSNSIPSDITTISDDSNCMKVNEMRKLLLGRHQYFSVAKYN